MAVRINEIRPQVGTPGGKLSTPTLNMGDDRYQMSVVNALVQGGERWMAERRENEEATNRVWAARELAGTQAWALERAQRLKSEVDPTTGAYGETLLREFDQRVEEVSKAAPNERTRLVIQERLAPLRGQLQFGSFETQMEAQATWQRDALDETAKAAESAVALDINQYGEQVVQFRAAMQGMPWLTEEQRRQMDSGVREQLAVAGVGSEVERDPYAAAGLLRRRLGINAEGPIQISGQMEPMLAEANARIGRGETPDQVEAWLAEQVGVQGFQRGGLNEEDPMAYRALSVPQTIQLLSRAESAIAQREAQARQARDGSTAIIRQRYQDRSVALANGTYTAPFSAGELEQAGIEPGAAQIMAEQQAVLAATVPVRTAMNTQTNEELMRFVNTPPQTVFNREADQRAYEVNVAHATQLLEQRQNDPGGYVIQHNGVVQQAFTRYSTALQTAAALGDAATPDQKSEVTIAMRDYITQSTQAQSALGITETKLPEQFLSAVATDFTTTFAQQPAVAVQRLSDIAQTLAENPRELGQVAERVGPVGVFAMEGVDPRALSRLAAVRQNTLQQNRALLPEDVTPAEIQDAVLTEAGPLLQSFSAQNAPEASARYSDGIRDLAMHYLTRGDAADENAAVRMAYNDLWAGQNSIATVNGSSFRIPNNEGSPDVVTQNLTGWIRSLSPDQFAAPALIGDPEIDATNAERWKRTVIDNGVWVNNSNDTGVMLTMGGYPVLNNEGIPLEIRFSDLRAMTGVLQREEAQRREEAAKRQREALAPIEERFRGNIPQTGRGGR